MNFKASVLDEDRFLKQKAKIDWLEVGDSNTKYFHNSMKAKHHQSRIDKITDVHGIDHEGGEVPKALVAHYESFLGKPGPTTEFNSVGVFVNTLDSTKANMMIQAVTDDEIKSALFSIDDNKAPGPDGYSSLFFKKTWDITGKALCLAVHDFFKTGRILKEINHTFLALIPKVDIQKAYDTIDRKFLRAILIGFGFHTIMVDWIMTCVTSASFSLSINGNIYGFFKGERGLRQGDPMSPYLFTLVMEVLSLILKKAVQEIGSFKFHNQCKKDQIINICFANDFFLFARGDLASVKVLMDGLGVFTKASGLNPSISNITAFFCNIPDHVKQAVFGIMPFAEGQLPIRYLGVPLISFRLLHKDCKVLVERMEAKISDWKNKSLSFVGRLQLNNSVLSSLHIYWASVFILPASIINDLEKKMRSFLWCQGPMSKGKAKVSWKDCCLPKNEGGLGIRRIRDVNKALMTSHIWSVINKRKSLWVKWIYSNKLNDRNFWDVPLRAGSEWGWRKMLLMRDAIRPHIKFYVGNGHSTFAWYDSWLPIGPLCKYISPREVTSAGFRLEAKVSNLINNGSWLWPSAWYDLFPVLIGMNVPILNCDEEDTIFWIDKDGNEVSYSTSSTWDSLRWSQQRVDWFDMVWFPHCIPRHSFHVWLILKKKLKTQDKLRQWDVSGSSNLNLLCCSLCKRGPDSHEHLFFECDYSSQIWNLVRPLAMFQHVSCSWENILQAILADNPKLARMVIGKLLVAAMTYFIWQEQNNRLLTPNERTVNQMQDLIVSTVRLKLVTLKIKRKTQGRRILEAWNIPKIIDKGEDCEEDVGGGGQNSRLLDDTGVIVAPPPIVEAVEDVQMEDAPQEQPRPRARTIPIPSSFDLTLLGQTVQTIYDDQQASRRAISDGWTRI
uniref:uncharacterized protein LOC122601315 n=1 Tax=Erigeron canadensis TaxID=72917 RepID=UPI001CB9C3A5|nr:uncharacterized protein LOC122601315 [Erigeron canadensis]